MRFDSLLNLLINRNRQPLRMKNLNKIHLLDKFFPILPN